MARLDRYSVKVLRELQFVTSIESGLLLSPGYKSTVQTATEPKNLAMFSVQEQSFMNFISPCAKDVASQGQCHSHGPDEQ